MIAGARSYKQGQVTRDEALAVMKLSRDRGKAKGLIDRIDDLDDYQSDLFVVDGDLRIAGDLDLMKEGIFLLAIRGDLVVDGVYHDYDDPETFLLVTGAMTARDVLTAGWLEVHGELTARGSVIGDYNHGGAHLGGLRARVFYPEHHHFEVTGPVAVEYAVDSKHRLETATPLPSIEMDDPRLLEIFDAALLRVFEDHDADDRPITIVDGFQDFREIKRRVAAGVPLKTAP
jgi:hypothetical protein